MLVLDLSQPQELWQTYQTLYDAIAKRVKFCISEASKQNPNLKEKLKDAILKRIGNAVCRTKDFFTKTSIELSRTKMKSNLYEFHFLSSDQNMIYST